MKKLKSIAILFLLTAFLFGTSSCLVVHTKDNGKHKGWFKNSKNPHNPNSSNPGNGNGKGKGKK